MANPSGKTSEHNLSQRIRTIQFPRCQVIAHPTDYVGPERQITFFHLQVSTPGAITSANRYISGMPTNYSIRG